MRWSLSEFRYAWKFYTPANFRCFFKELPKRWKKRIKLIFQWLFTGQTEQSVYSLNDYLAIVISQKLKLFKKHNIHTFPYNPEDGINTPEDWEKIVDKMIDGFDAFKNYYDNENDVQERLYKTLELFSKYFYNLWD